jgi:hypothetical protein
MDIIIGIVQLIAFLIVINFVIGFMAFRKQQANHNKPADLNDEVQLKLEVHNDKGVDIYLLFNAIDDTFVMQGKSTEELVKMIHERFLERKVLLIIPNGMEIPLVTLQPGAF